MVMGFRGLGSLGFHFSVPFLEAVLCKGGAFKPNVSLSKGVILGPLGLRWRLGLRAVAQGTCNELCSASISVSKAQ